MRGSNDGGARSAALQIPAAARVDTPDSRTVLQVLLDYLPSAVTLFGPDLEMIACNAKLRELLDFPDALFEAGLPSLPTLLRFNALRGEYGPGDPEAITAAAVKRAREMKPHVFERTRPNGVVLEIRGTPLPGGGFVTIYTDITERRQNEKAMRDNDAELRLLTDNVPALINYFDSDMNCVFSNRRYADFFGLALSDVVGKPLLEIIGIEAFADLEGHLRNALAGQPVTYQRMVRLEGGAQRWLEVKLVPRVAEDGSIPGCYAMSIDITEQKQTEEALLDSIEQMRLFTDNVPSMTVSWDENLCCSFANKRFAEFFDIPVENLLGRHMSDFIGKDTFREVEKYFAQALRGHPTSYQRLHHLANGESRYIEVKLLPHIAHDGRIIGCYAVTTDITEQKQTEERIRHLAHHDNLTGLPNRLLFNDRLSQEISYSKRSARRFALLYLDLDNFKPVNDAHGHNAGDELLCIVSQRLREHVRESDTVARVGGDEFTVIMRDIHSRENVAAIAAKIVSALAEPCYLERHGTSVDVGTSIGIALYPDDAQDHETLVRIADATMYSAKAQGSCFRFFAD